MHCIASTDHCHPRNRRILVVLAMAVLPAGGSVEGAVAAPPGFPCGDHGSDLATCVDYSGKPHWENGVLPSRSPGGIGVDIDGGLGFMTSDDIYDDGWLQLYDLRNPANPRELGGVRLWEPVSVRARGDFAYVAEGHQGLRVVDVHNPNAPRVIGKVNTPGHANNVWLSGDYAYVADGSGGLVIADVSDPDNPAFTGHLPTPGTTAGVFADGKWAYLADGPNGLVTVNVIDPAAPYAVATVATPGLAKAVWVSADHAYVAMGGAGLGVVDVSNPEAPVWVRQVPIGGECEDLCVEGDRIYLVSYGESSLVVADISDRDNPRLIGNCFVGDVYDIGVDNGVIVVSAGGNDAGMTVLRAGDGYSAKQFWQGRPGVGAGWRIGVADGTVACIAGRDGILRTVDVSAPAAPGMLGEALFGGLPNAVAAREGIAGVATEEEGVTFFDISDPRVPRVLSTVETSGSATAVELPGDGYAYVATLLAAEAVVVVDLQAGGEPVAVASVAMEAGATDLAYYQGYLYVGSSAHGVHLVDVHDPLVPVLAPGRVANRHASELAIEGNHLYIAGSFSSFRVFDLSDPVQPLRVGSFSEMPDQFTRDSFHILARGGYVYWSSPHAGVTLLDVRHPEHIFGAGSFSWAARNVQDIAFADDALLGADAVSGLVNMPLQCE